VLDRRKTLQLQVSVLFHPKICIWAVIIAKISNRIYWLFLVCKGLLQMAKPRVRKLLHLQQPVLEVPGPERERRHVWERRRG
jgi:hypothetical protein